MTFDAGALTFQEFIMQEPLPLATIHSAILEFLRQREDVVLFGAQAVNAYVDEPRMTQDIDLAAVQAAGLVQELRQFLHERFHIATRVREVSAGRGYRLYQVQKAGNRHLVDVRAVDALPPSHRIAGVQVIAPADLVAAKILAYQQRRGHPKSGTDWRDLAMLLLRFPELKRDPGPVTARLEAMMAGPETMAAWRELVKTELRPLDDDGDF